MKIRGKREGRPGVWLIEPGTAKALVRDRMFLEVHTFLGDGMPLMGASWKVEQAIAFFDLPGKRVSLIFPPNLTVAHQLVAIDGERRVAFDIGKIDEDQMEETP